MRKWENRKGVVQCGCCRLYRGEERDDEILEVGLDLSLEGFLQYGGEFGFQVIWKLEVFKKGNNKQCFLGSNFVDV